MVGRPSLAVGCRRLPRLRRRRRAVPAVACGRVPRAASLRGAWPAVVRRRPRPRDTHVREVRAQVGRDVVEGDTKTDASARTVSLDAGTVELRRLEAPTGGASATPETGMGRQRPGLHQIRRVRPRPGQRVAAVRPSRGPGRTSSGAAARPPAPGRVADLPGDERPEAHLADARALFDGDHRADLPVRSRTSSGRPPSGPRRWCRGRRVCLPRRRMTPMCPPCAHRWALWARTAGAGRAKPQFRPSGAGGARTHDLGL
jgi:hypothetical protein